MNASKNRKFVWWSHGANATRSTAAFFDDCFGDDFWNYASNESGRRGSHEFGIPKGCEDFLVISNVRNPYTLIVSIYRDMVDDHIYNQKDIPIFRDWIFSQSKNGLDVADDLRWNVVHKVPDIFIHMETLEEDLKNLPFIKEWLLEDEKNNNILEGALDRHIRTNCFTGESSGDTYKNGFQDITGFYDQLTASQVVNLFGGEYYFDKIGYDIDSWKS